MAGGVGAAAQAGVALVTGAVDTAVKSDGAAKVPLRVLLKLAAAFQSLTMRVDPPTPTPHPLLAEDNGLRECRPHVWERRRGAPGAHNALWLGCVRCGHGLIGSAWQWQETWDAAPWEARWTHL